MSGDSAGWMDQARVNGLEFTDGNGSRWRIFEIAASGYHSRGPHLICESAAVVRRVTTFPTDWRLLSVAELERVCSSPQGLYGSRPLHRL